MPKFKKVNDHTIKIIVEKAEDVPIDALINNKKAIEEQIVGLKQTLKNINEILTEAKKLGITPKPKDAGIKTDEKKPNS